MKNIILSDFSEKTVFSVYKVMITSFRLGITTIDDR